jgi:hypothetical protein
VIVVMIHNVYVTCFTVSKCMRSRVTDFNPTNRRTCVLRIRGKFKNRASSVPMLQWRKRVKERRMNLRQTREDVQAIPLIRYKNHIR